MNYFGQVVFDILQKIASWKAIFETQKQRFCVISWNFLKEKLNLAKSCCCFFKKTLKYTYQLRDATNGYCQVLNMKLNIGFDIPSKYIEDFCIIVSVSLWVYFQN